MTPSTSQNSTGDPSWFLIRLVSPTGITKNSTIDSATASTIVPAHTARGISCCSGSGCSLTSLPVPSSAGS